MLQKRAPLVIRPRIDIYMLRWLYRTLMQCNLRSYRVTKSRMLRVATSSRPCLEGLRRDPGIAYEEPCRGTLQMSPDQKGLADAAKDIEILQAFGVEHGLLDRAGCIAQDPARTQV